MAHAAYRTDYERELVLHYDELALAEAQQQRRTLIADIQGDSEGG